MLETFHDTPTSRGLSAGSIVFAILAKTAVIVLSILPLQAQAWNALGHQIIAQIAYDHLKPTSKNLSKQYLPPAPSRAAMNPFVYSATWLDFIRIRDIHWYDPLHYVDIPFSKDNTSLPNLARSNALEGINQAMTVLGSKKSSATDKALALRILIHVVGDIHQPLHTATLVSKTLPHGDRGGNLYPLGDNSIANQLHAYWDKGGGYLLVEGLKNQGRAAQVRIMAKELTQQYGCREANKLKKPEQWANTAHQLAIQQAYAIAEGTSPDETYQNKTQEITTQQLTFAGCRLALLLNTLSEQKSS